jgi:aminoglycoside phosphotransferase (APT) family kinase protein
MFYVMAHVPGRIFLDCTMPDLTREERAAVFDSVNETLARLHEVDHAALGLTDFGKPGNYFARQIVRWSQHSVQMAANVRPSAQAAWLQAQIAGAQ